MKKLIFLLYLVLLVILFSCKKNNDQFDNGSLRIESAITNSFTQVKITSTINFEDSSKISESGLCWSNTFNPTITNTKQIHNRKSGTIYTVISNLDSITTYHFRAYVIINGQAVYSNDSEIRTHGLITLIDKEYTKNGIPALKQVIVNDAGSFIMMEQLFRQYGTGTWCRLSKVDTSGNLLWSNEYNPTENKEPSYLLKANGNYFIVNRNVLAGRTEISLMKIDQNGTKVWEKNFSRDVFQDLIHVKALSNNTISLTTRTYPFPSTDSVGNFRSCYLHDFLVDETGSIIQESQLPNPSLAWGSYAKYSIPTNDNGFFASNYDGPYLQFVMRLQKFDQQKQLLWERNYGEPNKDNRPRASLVNTNGNFTIVGSIAPPGPNGSGNMKTALFEIDKNNGNLVWQKNYENFKFGSQTVMLPENFVQSVNGNYYITGTVALYSSNTIIYKADNEGNFIWDYIFPDKAGVFRSSGFAIFVDSNSNTIFLFGKRLPNQQESYSFFTKLKEY